MIQGYSTSSPSPSAARARLLVLGVFLLLGVSAGAQNLLQNGDFETAPLGPTNWTVGYLHGGPDDWEIKDRSRGGERRPSQYYGGYFRVLSQELAHAYFTQTVSNLTAGHTYNFVGHTREGWWKSASDALRDDKPWISADSFDDLSLTP